MRSIRTYILFLAAVVAVSFVSVNAQDTDRTLEQRIYKRILGLPEYGVFDHITFELQGGTVVLNGKVASFGTRKDAEREVKDLPGVNEVINNIEQLPASFLDDEIRQRALIAFVHSGAPMYFATPRPDVRIIVENGRLSLEGYVAYKGHSDTLNVVAHGIPGVLSVENNLIVGRDAYR